MKRLIHRLTGTEMWVADNRVEEYLAAGHIPAPDKAEEPKKEPAKKKRSK